MKRSPPVLTVPRAGTNVRTIQNLEGGADSPHGWIDRGFTVTGGERACHNLAPRISFIRPPSVTSTHLEPQACLSTGQIKVAAL